MRANLFSSHREPHAPTSAKPVGASPLSTTRRDAAHALGLLFLLLSLSTLPTLLVPTVSADQQPAGSASYYHVGDNLLQGWLVNNGLAVAADGNESSGATVNTQSGASSTVNMTYAWGQAGTGGATQDMMHVHVTDASGSACCGFGLNVRVGLIFNDGTSMDVFNGGGLGTNDISTWVNWSAGKYVSTFYFQRSFSGCNCAGLGNTMTISELAIYNKNATTSDSINALANNAAANVQCYGAGAAYANFASNSYTAPFGTFYVMAPSIMHASSSSPPDAMQIYAPLGGVNATFYAWSRVTPDITGQHSDAVAVWKVTTTQAGLPIYVKPSGSANVAATDMVCAFSRVDDMYSSTLASGYITAPLTTWGGSATDLWGVVYMANAYPANPVYDTDLSGQVPSLFSLDNMTFGAQLFPNGTLGATASVSIATLPPFTRAGNAILIALGQSASAQATSTSYQITVNGLPATVLANSGVNAQGYQYALFLVDDVALRNGLNETAGNVGQSDYRPLLGETYSIGLSGGFDPNYPVYAGNTYGLTGHAAIACFTLCGANMISLGSTLPTQNSNLVAFQVLNATTQQPVAGARVLNTNATTAQTTNAAGWANFTGVFAPTHFTISATGYAATCADFTYKSQSVPVNGSSDSLGCGYVIGTSASFTVLLGTTQSVTGNGGSVVIGGAAAVQISFNVTNPTFQPGQLIQVTVNRTQPVEVWVVLYELDAAGNPQRAGGFTPYDWSAAQPHSLPVSWPDGRTLISADAGSYVLTVSAQGNATKNGTLLAYDPIGVAQAAPNVGTSLLTNLNLASQNDINTQAAANNIAAANPVTEATVQQDFLSWLDWFPRTDLFVPNAVLYPALFMVGALMLRFGRTQWGR